MTSLSKRALRRQHYDRLKKKRVRDHHFGRRPEHWSGRHLGVAVNTPCNCSCHMCGNPRRSNSLESKTLAERRNQEAMHAQLDELVR